MASRARSRCYFPFYDSASCIFQLNEELGLPARDSWLHPVVRCDAGMPSPADGAAARTEPSHGIHYSGLYMPGCIYFTTARCSDGNFKGRADKYVSK